MLGQAHPHPLPPNVQYGNHSFIFSSMMNIAWDQLRLGAGQPPKVEIGSGLSRLDTVSYYFSHFFYFSLKLSVKEYAFIEVKAPPPWSVIAKDL